MRIRNFRKSHRLFSLGQQLPGELILAAHIGQAAVATFEEVGQVFVIDAQ